MTGKEDALGQGGGEGEKSRGAVMLIYCEPNHCWKNFQRHLEYWAIPASLCKESM